MTVNKSKTPSIDQITIRSADLNLQQPLGRFLITLFRQFEDELVEELRKRGYRSVIASDFNVLRFVDPQGISAVEIARLAGITKQAVSKQIAKLERAGFLKRKAHPTDQRARIVVFTKKGEKLLTNAIVIIQAIEDRYISLIGAREVNRLKKKLGQLLKS